MKNKHGKTIVQGAKEATCTEEGYTGDTVCQDCNTILSKGTAIAALGHTFTEQVRSLPVPDAAISIRKQSPGTLIIITRLRPFTGWAVCSREKWSISAAVEILT